MAAHKSAAGIGGTKALAVWNSLIDLYQEREGGIVKEQSH